MPEVTVDVEVYCAKCGEGLCNQTESTRTRRRQEPAFLVAPCEKCLQDAYDRGFDAGYDKAQAEAEATQGRG